VEQRHVERVGFAVRHTQETNAFGLIALDHAGLNLHNLLIR
jgi:hypothetical protein